MLSNSCSEMKCRLVLIQCKGGKLEEAEDFKCVSVVYCVRIIKQQFTARAGIFFNYNPLFKRGKYLFFYKNCRDLALIFAFLHNLKILKTSLRYNNNNYSTIHALELIHFDSNTQQTTKTHLKSSASSNFPQLH